MHEVYVTVYYSWVVTSLSIKVVLAINVKNADKLMKFTLKLDLRERERERERDRERERERQREAYKYICLVSKHY